MAAVSAKSPCVGRCEINQCVERSGHRIACGARWCAMGCVGGRLCTDRRLCALAAIGLGRAVPGTSRAHVCHGSTTSGPARYGRSASSKVCCAAAPSSWPSATRSASRPGDNGGSVARATGAGGSSARTTAVNAMFGLLLPVRGPARASAASPAAPPLDGTSSQIPRERAGPVPPASATATPATALAMSSWAPGA